MFPIVLVVMNSFKERDAIFRDAARTADRGDVLDSSGYETLGKRGDFGGVHRQQRGRHRRRRSPWSCCFGAMAAFALARYRFAGNRLLGLYLALGIMIPIRLGTVSILQLIVRRSA